LDFYRPVENPDKSKPLWGENQWPAIPGFKKKYEIWIDKMKALGLIVMEAYDPLFSSSSSTLKSRPDNLQDGSRVRNDARGMERLAKPSG
jgi:hypothetical protein